MNGQLPNICIVIPAYEPDEKLIGTAEGLLAFGWKHIVVVNDGSSDACRPVFEKVSSLPGVTLLTHEVNRGKGAAMKTAFAWLKDNLPELVGVVTADADGQHTPEDIGKVASALRETPDTHIIGARDFSLPQVPKKSRMGNTITSFVFRFLCGINIGDTQTGLRGYPMASLEKFLSVKGDRYEFETNSLLALRSFGIPFREVPIETVYIDDNASSHFHPVRDSLRIYALILKFLFSSLSATLIDLFVFWLLSKCFPGFLGHFNVLFCTVLARAVSSLYNFAVNRRVVFGSTERIGKTLVRYYLLAIPQMLISALLVTLLTGGITLPILKTLLKAVVDTLLFFISFRIQREWVFGEKPKKN